MMGNHALQVFLYEFRRNFRRKGFLFMTFGVPIIAFVLLFGYQAIQSMNAGDDTSNEAEDEFALESIETAGYVDFSGLFPEPSDEGLSEVLFPYADEASAQAALEAEEIDVYYIITSDYLETGDVEGFIPQFSIGKISEGEGLIERLVYASLGDSITAAELMRLRFPANIEEFNLERSGDSAEDEGANFATGYIFTIVFIVGIMVTNSYLMQSVIEEKESHLIEILLSSLRPTQLLMGKIFALGLMGLLQILVWGAAVIGLFNAASGLSAFDDTFLSSLEISAAQLPIMMIYFVLGYLLVAAAFSAIGALSNSMREGPQYSALIIIPVCIPYYFVSVFVETPHATLPMVLSMFPLTAPLSMILRTSLGEVPFIEIVISLVLLALSVVGMIWLAGRLFRVQTLLAGQMPKLRDIPKLIRG